MKQKLLKLLITAVFIVCLFFVGMYTSIELITYNDHFFETQYQKNDVSLNTGIEQDQLMLITDEMQRFLKGQRNDFDIYATIDGKYQAVFDAQEQYHMLDVQKLFVSFKIVRNICLGILVVLCLILYRRRRSLFFDCLKKASIIILIFSAILGIGVTFFFEPIFIGFHHLFFSNDMWLFDPYTSVLINMVPEEFFISCAIRIVLYNLIYYIALVTFGILGKRNALKKGI